MKKNRLPYKKQDSFKVPEGYFETLETRLMESAERGTVERKKKNSFSVPGDYFDRFEDKLFKKIEEEAKPVKVRSLFNRENLFYAAGVAAVFAVIVSSFLFNPAGPERVEEIDMVILEGYLHETLEHPISEFPQMSNGGEFEMASSTEVQFDQEALLEYLNENIEEPALIFNNN